MIKRKAHVYRLKPNPMQESILSQWVGAVRAVYNVALEQRRDWWRTGRTFNIASQCREVTLLRAEFDWLKAVPVHALQQGIRDLDRAYQNWWSGRSGAPSPRKRGMNDAMRFPDPNTFAFRRTGKRAGQVKLPKLGWVNLRWDKAIPGVVKNITVSRKAGQWFVAAQYEYEAREPEPSTLPVVGLDRGVSVFAALSDGTMFAPVNAGKKALRVLARAQRNLARKKRGSANRRKAVCRVQKLHARVRRVRNDYLHKVSHTIAKNHGVVVMEDLKVQNMSRSAAGTVEQPGKNVAQKRGLNRSILDQGWGMFRTMLGYKMADKGGRVALVNPRNTSRTCSACGVVDADSRKAHRFRCTGCAHEAHADTNAAINIKRRWDTPVQPAEASDCRASEAGTSQEKAYA